MRVFLVGLFVVLLAVGAGVWYGVVGQRNLPIEERQFGKNNLLRWDKGEVLSTRLGKVKGLTNGRSSAFLGLPYAEPPVKNNGDTHTFDIGDNQVNWGRGGVVFEMILMLALALEREGFNAFLASHKIHSTTNMVPANHFDSIGNSMGV